MGCSSSREGLSSISATGTGLDPSHHPVSRTLSLPTPLVHHPPLCKGDTHHLVSLTSTTYGSLHIDPLPETPPKSPFSDHRKSHQPETINTWELMEGLEEIHPPAMGRSYTFHAPQKSKEQDYPNSMKETKHCFLIEPENSNKPDNSNKPNLGKFSESSKPLWMHLSEESLLADMDPDVVSSFRKASATRVLSASKSFCNSPCLNQPKNRPISSAKVSPLDRPAKGLPGTENKIVVYFTSLRGIRRTYEDCSTVRLIFQGFRVLVDERDISMDSSYRKELQCVLGEKNVSLPQVFIRGRHIGGADEIKHLLEIGELGKLLQGFPVQEHRYVCDSCGGVRFVPCPNCYGSRKVFTEDEELQRCSECNENGLIRCPACCC